MNYEKVKQENGSSLNVCLKFVYSSFVFIQILKSDSDILTGFLELRGSAFSVTQLFLSFFSSVSFSPFYPFILFLTEKLPLVLKKYYELIMKEIDFLLENHSESLIQPFTFLAPIENSAHVSSRRGSFSD